VSSYVFPGYPAFLESAASELGLPGSARAAGRIVPLTALANLCAQAAHGTPAHAPGILARAAEFRDQIAVALWAAELMLAEVEAARGLSPSEDRGEPEPEPDPSLVPTPPAESRKPRKASSNQREPS
jgi:hypothetical protein